MFPRNCRAKSTSVMVRGETPLLHRLGAGEQCKHHNRTTATSCHTHLILISNNFKPFLKSPWCSICRVCLSETLGFGLKKTTSAAPKTDPSFIVWAPLWGLSLAPGSSPWQHRGLPGYCLCPGVCSLLGSCPNVWDAPLGLSLPQCSLCQPAQPLSKSFHGVSYRLLFISASLPPHY